MKKKIVTINKIKTEVNVPNSLLEKQSTFKTELNKIKDDCGCIDCILTAKNKAKKEILDEIDKIQLDIPISKDRASIYSRVLDSLKKVKQIIGEKL